MLEKALRRPYNYESLPTRKQWQIDKILGILDWIPTKEEEIQYKKIRNEKLDDERLN